MKTANKLPQLDSNDHEHPKAKADDQIWPEETDESPEKLATSTTTPITVIDDHG